MGHKDLPGAQFSLSFSQLPVVKKDTENFAPGQFFGDFNTTDLYITDKTLSRIILVVV